jgi:amino acid adenylation domain-containing protein
MAAQLLSADGCPNGDPTLGLGIPVTGREPDPFVQRIFELQVTRVPDSVAVDDGHGTLTYAALNSRANQVANALIRHGVQPDDLVGVCTEHCIDMVVGLLAAIKAGAACVPVDPALPHEHLTFINEDAALKVLLSHEATLEVVSALNRPAIMVDGQLSESVDNAASPTLRPNNLGYVTYTRSTVFPLTGILIEHRSIRATVDAIIQGFGLQLGARVLQDSPLRSDACFWKSISSLCAGATAYIHPGAPLAGKAVLDVAERAQLTHLILPPSVLESAPPHSAPACLTTVIASEEPCTKLLARRWMSGTRCVISYGRTEASFLSTTLTCSSDMIGTSPIGRPVAGTCIHILAKDGRSAPVGTVGEIYIGGGGLARGYLNHPALTAERFSCDPYNSHSRVFRTGNLGRWMADDMIEIVGRDACQSDTVDLFDAAAEEYETINEKLQYIGPSWLAKHLQEVKHLSGLHILDLGCATGLHVQTLSKHVRDVHAVGVDISPKMVARATATGCFQHVFAHDLHLPLPFALSESFDLVLALGFLEFLSEPEICLSEIRRVLKSRGKLWASFQRHDPAASSPAAHDFGGGSQRRMEYSADDILEMMRKNELHVYDLEPVIGYYNMVGAGHRLPCPYYMLRAERLT